jgi:hypothetical protein
MQAARAWKVCSVLVCGSTALPLSACDNTVIHEQDALAGEDAVASIASPLAADCAGQGPGDGFVHTPLPSSTTLGITDFAATATGDLALDAVIAVSSGQATSFNQLAAAVRFNTSGMLDVRDGSTYRADSAVTTALGHAFRIRVVADTSSHTYSVYVRDGDVTTRLARRYAFRPTQATVASLDNLASIVDGAAGQLSICDVVGTAPTRVAYSREGAYAVFPMAADQVLASDGISTTLKLGANGQVLGQVARGGHVTADPSGQPYVALAANGQLAVDAYTAALAPRWNRVDPVPADTRVLSTMADAGGLMIALTSNGQVSVARYPASGGPRVLQSIGGTHVALGPDGYAIGMHTPGSALSVGAFSNTGASLWFQSYQAAPTATIEVMTLGVGGRIVVGGHFSGPINFGGPTLEPVFNGEVNVNSYVVALDHATGAHAFTTRIPTTRLTGAAANASRLVIAGETWVTPIFPHLWQLDTSGAVVGGEPDTGFYEQWGRSGRVALDASGRIYWERSMMWPSPVSEPFPYLIALTP